MSYPTPGMDLEVATPGVEVVRMCGNLNGLDDVMMVVTYSLAFLASLLFRSLCGTVMRLFSRCSLVVTWMSFCRSSVLTLGRPFLELIAMVVFRLLESFLLVVFRGVSSTS